MAINTGELAAKAVVKEVTLGVSPVDTAAKSLRATLDQKGAEATLMAAAGRVVDLGQIDHTINENIGTERGTDGKKVIASGSDEEKRLDRVKPIGELLKKYLDQGYDKLTTTEADKAQKAVIDLAKSIPAFAPILSVMSAGEQQQFAERILKDPRFVALAKQGLLEQIDLTKIKADNVSQLQVEFDNLSKEVKSMTSELGQVNKRIKELEDALLEHQVEIIDPTTGAKRAGKTYDRINNARGEIGTKGSSIIGDEQDLDVKVSELEYFQNELNWATGKNSPPTTWTKRSPADVKKDIGTKSTEIDLINKKILPVKLEIKQREDLIKQLEKEADDFKQEKGQKEGRKKELETQKLEKDKEAKTKQALLGKAKADRAQYEEAFVRGMESVLTNAADQYIKDRVGEATTESKAMLEKEAQEAKDRPSKVIEEEELKRYFINNKIKAEQARSDYDTLLKYGPDGIINSMLLNQYSATEVANIMKDPAFMEQMGKKVATDIVKFYALRGGWFDRAGKINSDEIIKLSSSPWGVKVIEDAMAGKQDIQNKIKAAYPNLPERAKWGEWLRGADFKKLLMILLIIAGIAAGGAFFLGAKSV